MQAFSHRQCFRQSRILLLALAGILHGLLVPCAMASASTSMGEDCGHCRTIVHASACMAVADQGGIDDAAAGRSVPRSSPPTGEHVLLLPMLATAATPRSVMEHRPPFPAGYHPGAPPLHILHLNIRR